MQADREKRTDHIARVRLGLKKVPQLNRNTIHIKKVLQKQPNQQIPEEITPKGSFQDQYKMGQKIGEGAHGVVRRCFSKTPSNLQYVVKITPLDDEHIHFLRHNFRAVKALNHPHIIKYVTLHFDRRKNVCYLVMEYYPYPNLLQKVFEEDQLRRVVYQLINTLKYLHYKHICHRDIKPQNILYDGNCVKVIDFGISCTLLVRHQFREMLTVTGTPYYRAPEMFQGGGYDERVDLWALGITMYKLMTGVTPFQSLYHSDTITNIIKRQFTFPPVAFSKFAKNLVIRLLKPKKERLTAAEAQKDLWFTQLMPKQEEHFNKSAIFSLKTKQGSSNISQLNLSQLQNRKMSTTVDANNNGSNVWNIFTSESHQILINIHSDQQQDDKVTNQKKHERWLS